MNVPAPHARLLADAGAAGLSHPLALAGGHALEAHGLIERPHADVDLATEAPEPMEEVTAAVERALTDRGHEVAVRSLTPLSAQLTVTDPETGETSELSLHKEALRHPLAVTDLGPVLALEDAVGTKIRALYDRGAAVDLIDARAAAARFGFPELEELGRRHARDPFDLPTLQSRLTGSDYYPDSAFTAYGLDAASIPGLRAWAQHWSDDIAERLLEEGASPDADPEP
ncbi:nucleotidyl transferase AbiEii/AbiGii toxin family protein [Streptomyces galbus]|uniref:Nucleotidyl transferase AbiEii/AbiGii toxin family protein n=1 Tax=Streptomyces galbus TaxID=33898 RepID=A0A4U5X7P5_STRGB|nr:nucleotidyl transferase AbiEii/AbiGii toxin family protein [Streptomyces galbus]TKT11345.1 nucleotidyl transferase AbiEii/AbiGii toxin family protein [Streptomyces galbus]